MSVKRILKWSVITFIFLFSYSVMSQEQNKKKNRLVVHKHAFCRKVEKREPVGASKEFPSDIGRVYFWTSITGTEKPTKIKHIWYYGKEKKLELPLDVKYKRTRTWSYKTILSDWVGKWYVKVVDEDGNELGKFTFTILTSPK